VANLFAMSCNGRNSMNSVLTALTFFCWGGGTLRPWP